MTINEQMNAVLRAGGQRVASWDPFEHFREPEADEREDEQPDAPEAPPKPEEIPRSIDAGVGNE